MELLTALGLAIPAGLNAYIPLLAVAVAERVGWLRLDAPYSLLGEWWAIALIAVLLVVEIVADKVPVVDHANDVVQTFVRPVAGGLVAAAATSGSHYIHPAVMIVAGILLAGGVHAVKATTRPVINATTAGVGAPVTSAIEDVVAAVMSVLAIVVPVAAALLGIALVIWLAGWWRKRRAQEA